MLTFKELKKAIREQVPKDWTKLLEPPERLPEGWEYSECVWKKPDGSTRTEIRFLSKERVLIGVLEVGKPTELVKYISQ